LSIIDQTRYDAKIADAMRRFLPMWDDWRWLKAQLFQESRLDPNARSPAGAIGIAQFMPRTWDNDILTSCPGIPPHATPWDPEFAIPAAAWYMSRLRSWWKTDRPEDDRRRLAQASYNCGFGNLCKAQQFAGGAREYRLIIAHLHEVTGAANATETRTYVEHIQRYYDELVAADVPDFSNVESGSASTAPKGTP